MMSMKEEFESAMNARTKTEASVWLQERIAIYRRVLECEHTDFWIIREIIRNNLAYFACYYGHEAQHEVFELYGATHPVVASMSDDERDGRHFFYQFSEAEISAAARRVVFKATGEREV